MKNTRYKIQDRKSASFFDKWIFGSYYDYSVLSHLGGGHSGGGKPKVQPPGASSIGIFEKSYRKVSRWNVTIPKIKLGCIFPFLFCYPDYSMVSLNAVYRNNFKNNLSPEKKNPPTMQMHIFCCLDDPSNQGKIILHDNGCSFIPAYKIQSHRTPRSR
jgi:hypothetical protein